MPRPARDRCHNCCACGRLPNHRLQRRTVNDATQARIQLAWNGMCLWPRPIITGRRHAAQRGRAGRFVREHSRCRPAVVYCELAGATSNTTRLLRDNLPIKSNTRF